MQPIITFYRPGRTPGYLLCEWAFLDAEDRIRDCGTPAELGMVVCDDEYTEGDPLVWLCEQHASEALEDCLARPRTRSIRVIAAPPRGQLN